MFEIRTAQISDAPAILDIISEHATFPILKLKEEDRLSCLEDHLAACIEDPASDMWVAEDSGGVMGYMLLHWHSSMIMPGPDGYVAELFVHSDHRGCGVGRRLLETARQAAGERGCFRLMLINNRQRDSYRRGFYRKNGWTERAHISNFVLFMEPE